MKQVNKHPRKTRTYKVTDLVYKKARKVAKSKKESLSTVIEGWVKDYANEMRVVSFSMDYGEISKLAPFVKQPIKK